LVDSWNSATHERQADYPLPKTGTRNLPAYRRAAAALDCPVTFVNASSLSLAMHGSIILLSGLAGGLFFARAIQRGSGEVAWRVVHAGGCAGGTMLLAIAMPVQWVSLSRALVHLLTWSLVLGAYLLVAGMFVAAVWNARGIPGGGRPVNRLVNALYAAGTVSSLAGCALLVLGLIRTYCCASGA
jgi:hypothetical protein